MFEPEQAVENVNNTNNNPAIDGINSFFALRINKGRMKEAVE